MTLYKYVSLDSGDNRIVRYDDVDDAPGQSGLSSSHISPHRLFDPNDDHLDMHVAVWSDGSLIKLNIKHNAPRSPSSSVRGEVTTFSRRSRKRLLDRVSQIKRDEIPVFVTLTYPGEFVYDFEDCKRHMDVWIKRIRRRFPECGLLWRVELATRLSGESMGEVVPHYHLFIWGANYSSLREFVAQSWNDVVAPGDANHLAAGVRVEKIRHWRGVMSYAGKYIAKVSESAWLGRHWGFSGRKFIPWSEVDDLILTESAGYLFRRAMMRFSGIRFRYKRGGSIFTQNPTRWGDLARSYGAGAIPF